LGTAGVLVASSALLLVVVSALMAFNAWPGGDPIGGLKGLVVDNHEPSLELTGPARVAADAAPAAAAVAATPTAGAAAPARGGLAAPVPPAGGGVSGGDVSQPRSTTQAPSGRGSGGPPAAAPGTPPAPDVPGVTRGIGGSVEQVTGGTGNTVSPVSPELGKGVTDTGKALSEIVQGIGGPQQPPSTLP
jgi:hypothetical protein